VAQQLAMSVALIVVTFAVLHWLEAQRSRRVLARRARCEQPSMRSQTRLPAQPQHQGTITAARP